MPRIFGFLATALAALLALTTPASAHQGDLLPDLVQLTPAGLQVERVMVGARPRFRLGFDSAAANSGDGPLTLHGHRADRRRTTMRVDQLVTQVAGAPRMVRDVGLMSYVVHPDHKHWHLLDFERYTIRDDAGRVLRGDRKTGFCLGDRFPTENARSLKGFRPTPMQGDTCGLGQPDLLGLFAGISVGYGDRYEAQLEGQFIDVTGLPAGEYVLAHSVNTGGRIVERNYLNNASSVRFALTWPRGSRRLPAVEVLRRCPYYASCR
jgi:Lysyl oxidase